ncbi:MAG: hypothetical protein IJU27_08330 [Bacteroidales bacterium]|nr:hypothetical protein [Bacteroidales bacterium]
MDIDLLSRMVKELILDHNIVGLPGLGSFVAEEIPSSFSDRGYTINPPYRRLSFHAGRGEDGLLAGLYSWSNGVSLTDAETILRHFISELREVLVDTKLVVLPGLGKLRATKDNNFFFVGDEDLDIFPEGFGLQPLSLKTHTDKGNDAVTPLFSPTEPWDPSHFAPVASAEENAVPAEENAAPAEENAASAAETAAPAEENAAPAAETIVQAETTTLAETTAPEETPSAEPAPAEETPAEEIPAEPVEDLLEPVEEKAEPVAEAPARKKGGFGQVLLVLLAVLLSLFIVYMVLARLAPGLIDRILYTPEELEIINYKL